MKRIYLEQIELDDSDYTEFARALSMQSQSQLEDQNLSNLSGDKNDSFMGHIMLGDTMKHWRSPNLKVLDIGWCLVDDGGKVAWGKVWQTAPI